RSITGRIDYYVFTTCTIEEFDEMISSTEIIRLLGNYEIERRKIIESTIIEEDDENSEKRITREIGGDEHEHTTTVTRIISGEPHEFEDEEHDHTTTKVTKIIRGEP